MILYFIMTSFYLTLNSDGSLDTHPNNNGGNFVIELYEEVYLPGIWEVALVEMSYFGQNFPNLPSDYNTIEVSSVAQDAHQTDFVLHYHEVEDFYVTLEIRYLVLSSGQWTPWLMPIVWRPPKQHYSFADLLEIFSPLRIGGKTQGDEKMCIIF